jgi:hypothetical protein
MPRFLIEIPHDSNEEACKKAVDVILSTGSHFFTHADWGCQDGEHKAWLVVDVDSRDEARGIVPVSFRNEAKIIQLNTFSIDDIKGSIHHKKA